MATNLADTLQHLWQSPQGLGDVWLVPDTGGTAFKAHRLVLAAASPVLKEALLQFQGGPEDPLLILDQVESQTILDLLAYLYRGQVTLGPARLAALLSLGRSIALKGIEHLEQTESLTGLSLLASAALDSPEAEEWRNDENEAINGRQMQAINLSTKPEIGRPMTNVLNIPDPTHFRWRRFPQPQSPLAVSPVTSPTPPPPPDSDQDHDHDDEPMETSTSLSPPIGSGKKWKSRQPKLCIHCDRYFSNQFNLKQHILNMHTVGGEIRCDKCNKTVKNKWYLRRHQVTHHNAPLKK